MSSTSQLAMLNQGMFEDQAEMPSQMGFLPFPQNLITFPPLGCHQYSLKAFNLPPSLVADQQHHHDHHVPSTTNLTETLLSSTTLKQREDDHIASDLGGAHLLSLQRSSANLW
ncbi:hypothetical protein JRO89_XS08G0042100 [Xanthoceras sorbifolium]|uniref:Uncharacterized protein n=1 Tax=Xanthoceras sorbifolium TaxID=99658 RepID=A0ABQ8HNL5_9ROSI|nr:hypothetical protein JRO89_XS08G0042100 [Xanthoceras sorbifolium]